MLRVKIRVSDFKTKCTMSVHYWSMHPSSLVVYQCLAHDLCHILHPVSAHKQRHSWNVKVCSTLPHLGPLFHECTPPWSITLHIEKQVLESNPTFGGLKPVLGTSFQYTNLVQVRVCIYQSGTRIGWFLFSCTMLMSSMYPCKDLKHEWSQEIHTSWSKNMHAPASIQQL